MIEANGLDYGAIDQLTSEILRRLRLAPSTRERALAVTKLQELSLWLSLDFEIQSGRAEGPPPEPPRSIR